MHQAHWFNGIDARRWRVMGPSTHGALEGAPYAGRSPDPSLMRGLRRYATRSTGVVRKRNRLPEADARTRAATRHGPEEGGLLRGARQNGGGGWGEVVGQRVVAPVAVHLAAGAFLLDVADLTARRQLAVAANDAAAGKCSEPQKSHQAHDEYSPFDHKQTVYR